MVIGYLKLFWNFNKYSERRFFSSNFLKLPQGVELARLKGGGGGLMGPCSGIWDSGWRRRFEFVTSRTKVL